MGDMADLLREQGEMAQDSHDMGICDGYCQLCYDEMTPEEKNILTNTSSR